MSAVLKALRAMPVSVNCYHGDPTLQWGNTVQKLEDLAAEGHTGPVSVITKGALGPARGRKLAELKGRLPGLLVMVSISGLGREFEKAGHDHRYRALATLREVGVPAFAAVRPLTPPYNTTPEVLYEIFSRLQAVGCETACVSGFRGDSSLIEAMEPSAGIEWVLRVKQMTGFDLVKRIADQCGVRLFTRVSCCASYLTGRTGTYNPYWGSPQLVRCEEIGCPLVDFCGPVAPDPEVVSWLERVGYDLRVEQRCQERCRFSADNRLNCKSCCTTCFVQPQPRVIVRNARTLGDLAFVRFVLGGTLAVKPGMIDGGDRDVGRVSVLSELLGQELHCINSWWVWATRKESCFGCRYCISTLYPGQGTVGCPPADLADMVDSHV